jgi:hypothetical protein
MYSAVLIISALRALFLCTLVNAKNFSYLRRVMEYRGQCYFIVQISQAFICHITGIPDI